MIAKYIKFCFSEEIIFNNYAIRRLTYKDKVPTLKFMQEQFFMSEPSQVAYYKQFPNQKSSSHIYWERVQNLFSAEIFQRGLSVGCFNMENDGELVGAALTKDTSFIPATDPYPPEGSFLYACRRLKEKMYASVVREYYTLVNDLETPMVDVWLVAVKPQHRKKGILKKMLSSVEYFGALQQYEYSFSWATNKNTAACYKQFGYQMVSEVDVRDFEDKGVKYFKEIEESQRYQSLWIKKLAKLSQVEYINA